MNEQPPLYTQAPQTPNPVPPPVAQPPQPLTFQPQFQPQTPQLPEQPPQAPKPPRKWPLFMAMLGLLLIVILVGIVWFFIAANNKDNSQAQSNGIRSATHSASFEQAYSRITAAYDIPAFESTKKSSLLAAYDDLSQGFSLTNNALDDDTTIMHAIGVASMYASDATHRDRYRTELYLLFVGKHSKLPSGITDSTFEGPDAQKTVDILKKYQSIELTKRLEQSSAIEGVLDATATQLKLGSKDKLSDYNLIAFDFNNTDPKFDQLTKEHSLYGARPKMWTEELGGKFYIMMFKSYAEQVISGTTGSLPHEFVHAQSPFARGETGRMIEERRAELFSGDKSAYYDTKQLVIYLNVFAGIDINSLLQQNPTNSAKLYATLYKQLGIPGTHALVFSWPTAYSGSDSRALSSIYIVNNQDIALQHALAAGKKEPEALEARVKQRYDKLLSVLKSESAVVSDLTNNLNRTYRMPSAANYMLDYIKSH